MDRYSVLISLYYKERPEYFREAMNSLLNQTIKPDEILLVEDGPLTDDLYEMVNEIKNSYPEIIKIVRNEQNIGLGESLKKGLVECTNELVARMDTDDISLYDRFEKQLIYFEKNPQVSIVGGQIEEFIGTIDNCIGKREVPCDDREIKEYMKKRCPFNHMTVMFKKSKVIEAGNYLDWFWNEDYYLWIRMFLKGCIFGNLEDTLVKVRVSDDMYRRRGGIKYFSSELGIQKLMLSNGIIGINIYIQNIIKRLIMQLLVPNRLRGWLFRKVARS